MRLRWKKEMKKEKGRAQAVGERLTMASNSFTTLVFLLGNSKPHCFCMMWCDVLQEPLSGHWRVCVCGMEVERRKLLIFGRSEALTKTLHVTPTIPMNNSKHRRMYREIRQDTQAWNLASSNKKKKKGNRREKKFTYKERQLGKYTQT